MLDTLDISDETEQMLQDAHDDEFVYVAPQRFYYDRCGTCNDRPLWGCSTFGCDEAKGCIIMCPSCGRNGFNEPEDGFVPDEALASLLMQRMGR